MAAGASHTSIHESEGDTTWNAFTHKHTFVGPNTCGYESTGKFVTGLITKLNLGNPPVKKTEDAKDPNASPTDTFYRTRIIALLTW